MADYTHYGVAAHEWVEFEKSYKPFSVPPGTSMAQQKKTFNESRVRLFRSVLGPVGKSYQSLKLTVFSYTN